MRGFYDHDIISTTWIGQGAGAWQREHVWASSKLGMPRPGNSTRSIASDVHNLTAITGVNQTRSSRYFDEGSGTWSLVGSNGFYPGDDFKGDVARILLYMVVMYDTLTLTDDVSLLTLSESYVPASAYSGKLSLLLQWHLEDPVDKFEIERNNFIYNGIAYDTSNNNRAITPQGNRNPFIDKPELVQLIWG